MISVARRLRHLRLERGLSLRALQQLLADGGLQVSHDSIRHYEAGTRSVPASYVKAVCRALGADPAWLLGEFPGVGTGRTADAWARYMAGFGAAGTVRPVILASWERSERAGIDGRARVPEYRRVPEEELSSRLQAGRELVDAAAPWLEWLVLHESHDADGVAYVTDAEGIVLASFTRHARLAEEWGLVPGVDWSERVMGTNGAGTALVTGQPTVVLGAEHYLEAFHGCSCLAAPLYQPDGRPAGALDLSLAGEVADPGPYLAVLYAACAIERKLADRVVAPELL